LTLQLDPSQADYSGHTTITITVGEDTSEIRLHAQDMQINAITLTGGGSHHEVTHRSGEHGLLFVESANNLAPGTYKLHIEFSNNFNTNGDSINRTEQEGRHYVFSQFEAISARQGFPCFDEPGFKFPWQVTMAVPDGQLAITNTPEVSASVENGIRTTVFDTTLPLPSYLIAVAAGPFETVPIDGMSIPGRVVVPHGKTRLAAWAVETTPPLLASLEDYFGEPYPFKKLDLIATNQGFSGAMEHPGAITYSDFFLLLDESASQSQIRTLAKITAHELAHQWFGNLVTMQWWNDLWLNESFADWMGDKTVEAVYPEFAYDLAALPSLFGVMDTDARPSTRPIKRDFSSTDNFSDGIQLAYFKGKSVIGMFETAVGPDVFRDGVVRYIRKYSRENATSNDLWASINTGADFDLAAGLASFISQPGIPLVTVMPEGAGSYRFSQSRFVTGDDTIAEQLWTIPLSYSYLTPAGLKTGKLVLSDSSAVVDLGTEVSWILPNSDQGGYFRWRIPTNMLRALGQDAVDHLNVRERMGLLSNMWALLSTEEISGEDFLAALAGLSSDSDPSVIDALLNQLASVRTTFITPDLRPEFASYVQAVLKPTFDRIGAQAIADESVAQASVRPDVLIWLAVDGQDEAAQAITAELTRAYLADEIPASDILTNALRAEARRGDQELFDQVLARLESAESPGDVQRYVSVLGSFTDPEIVEQVLNYMLTGKVQAVDMRTLARRLAMYPDNRELLLEWFMNHDAELRELVPTEGLGLMARIPDMLGVCSPDIVPTIIEFYGAPVRSNSRMEQELKDVEAEVMECWELQQREIGSVGDYLSSRAL
jgi:alanyl aminopeptidase